MLPNINKCNDNHIALAEKYRKASPFPHIVLDGFLENDIAEQALKVFPKVTDKGWIHYVHINEKKHGLNKLELIPEFIKNEVINAFNSNAFITYLENITGIKNLIPDKTIEGGGIHQSETGGYLNVHADFTVHPHHKNWRRRVNVLIYFNKDWQENYGGALEFWDKNMTQCKVRIAPIFNRVVIFNTNETSYHGFPEPITCPKHITRKSIALYYFTEENPKSFKRKATNYKARPNDGFKSILIWADKKLIAIYTYLKSHLGINDDIISQILNKCQRKK